MLQVEQQLGGTAVKTPESDSRLEWNPALALRACVAWPVFDVRRIPPAVAKQTTQEETSCEE